MHAGQRLHLQGAVVVLRITFWVIMPVVAQPPPRSPLNIGVAPNDSEVGILTSAQIQPMGPDSQTTATVRPTRPLSPCSSYPSLDSAALPTDATSASSGLDITDQLTPLHRFCAKPFYLCDALGNIYGRWPGPSLYLLSSRVSIYHMPEYLWHKLSSNPYGAYRRFSWTPAAFFDIFLCVDNQTIEGARPGFSPDCLAPPGGEPITAGLV